jgi:fimbrial isopeptide formation D2 family protein/uncharacterized repeat protein (TIGR01451 family)
MSIVSLVIAVAPIIVTGSTPLVNASGSPSLSLGEQAPATVLYGGHAAVSLTASDPGGQPWGYNLSFEDVLPAGVSYVPGSTSPASVGDPLVAYQPSTEATVLTWSNVGDLSPGSSYTLGFHLTAATDLDPAPNFLPGDSYTDSSSAYVNSDPRYVPQFAADGTPSNFTGSATAAGTTALSPLAISQTPGGAELRGVHDHQFVSTITVTNNDVHATDGISVTDWLPAGLEYLLCGQTDNTQDAATNTGSDDEYPGSGLIDGHTPSPADCVAPVSVATEDTDPNGDAELPTAVYTELEWTGLGDLAPSASLTLKFVTAIPIRANTMTWTSGTAPSAASLDQAANLDNNSGAETVDGTSLTVYATATGDYTGTLGTGGSNPVEATGYDTIVARDIVTSKSISDGTFTQDADVTYTITVSTSEYRYSDATTVTDTLPSGLCPLGDDNYDAQAAPECAPAAGVSPSPDYSSVAENSDGTFTLVWDLGHIDPNATDTVTFPAADRDYYQADDQNTSPTVGNDTLTNTEIAAGNLSVICADGNPDCAGGATDYVSHDTPITVDDVTATASVSQAAAGPTIDVYVSQNVGAGDPLSCATATYLSSSSAGYPPTYQDGDLICFKVDVSYPPGTDFKNPVVTDFIPPNTEYQSGSETTTAGSTADDVGFSSPATGELEWTMGDPLSDPDGNLYEQPGTLFEAEFSVIATADPTVGNDFDLTQDLAKLVTANTEGTTFTARGLVTYQLAAPIVTLSKAVTSINGSTAGVTPKNDTVRGSDQVGYTLTVTDTSIVDAYDVEVWDALPAQVDCVADVADISPASGSCVSGSGGDLIEWPPDAVPDLGAGASTQLTFTMEIPSTAGAGEIFANLAGVRSFVGEHNDSGQPDDVYYPEGDIDQSIPSDAENAPAADDSADVISAGAVVAKSAVTSITAPGNGNGDATIGETITYTVVVTVPHDTTFYDASLSDPLGSQQDYMAGSGQVTLPDGSTFTEAEESSESFLYAYDASSNTVNLTFPTSYPNSGPTDEQVTVVFSATVADVGANTANAEISNVATLTDYSSTGTEVTASNTPVDTLVVEPDVTIAKTVSPARIQPGGTNTFTITVSNPSGTGVSSAYDISGSDQIPAGLAYVAGSVELTGPSGSAGEDAGTGIVSWSIPELDPGQTDTISYEVNPPAPAQMTDGESWTNTAYLNSWYGVSGGPSGDVTGYRTYGPIHSAVNLPADFPALEVTKTTPDETAAFAGDPFVWKVAVTNSATVAVAGALAVTDTLPAGWSYDTGTTTITPPTGPPATTDPSVTVNGSGEDVLSWSDLGTLQPGKTLSIQYQATPSASLDTEATTGPAVPYTNSATATAEDGTGAPGNQTGQYTATGTDTTHIGDADLQITKTHTGNFSAGTTGTYTLTVKNNGPSAASTPITVIDTIVSPETFSSWSGTNWSCAFSNPTLTCTYSHAPLNSGSTAPTLSVVVSTPSGTPNGTEVTNTATVSSPTFDYNLDNNSSSNPTTIDANADMAITKSHSGSFTAGGQGTYTVSVVNNGPSDAVGPLTVTDTLPAGETLQSASGTDWTCGTVVDSQFSCTDADDLTSGSYAPPITEVVDVAASQAPGSITNSASVSSTTNDPVPGNNTSSNSTDIVTSADLALSKVHTGSFTAGDDGTYDFTVTNSDGPSNAAGPLTVTDTLPGGETFVSGGGSGWSCSVSSGTVSCTTSAGLDVGDSTSFPMTVAIASWVTVSTLTNSATLSSPTSDPFPSAETSTDNAGTTRSADLQLVKHLTSSLVAGEQATYSLSVTDTGPSDATGVTLQDTLPAGESFVDGSGTGWSCGVSSGTVTCTQSGSIVANAPASVVTLTVDLASDVLSTSITNPAMATCSDCGEATASTTDTSSTSADLSIAKTDDGPFTAGTDGEYQLNVGNAGPSDAQGPIQVTDALPSGESYVSATGAGWLCSASDQVVTCDDDAGLTVDTSAATIDLEVAVSPSLQSASVTNDASVSSPTSDPNPANNGAEDVTTIETSADLAISKTHSGDFTAGAEGTYTLTVTNNGPSDAATPLTVTDDVPSPFTLVSVDGGSDWDCSATAGNDVSCAAEAALPAGSTAPAISVEVSVPSSQAATSATNTAAVTSVTSDPDLFNNSSSDPTSIVTSADLTVTKIHQGTFTAGTDGSYLITVSNLGPSDAAPDLTVTDTLPSAETFISGTGTGWSCSAAGPAVTCTSPDPLPSGESAPAIDLSLAIASSASGSISNTATVSSPTSDPNPDNNSGSDSTILALSSDLSITKTHLGDFTAGLDGTYTIGVHDTGPSDSGTGVRVSDTLPTGETFVSGDGTGWSCSASGQAVTCTQASSIVVTGDAPSLQLTVAVGSGAVGTLTNVAIVEGPNPDPDLDNNTANDPTTTVQSPDLALTKTLIGPLQARSQAVYALEVSNSGPSDAAAPVTVTDPLPSGLSYVSSTTGSDGTWSCSAAGALVTCTDSAPVAAAATSTVQITVAVSAAAGTEVINTATAGTTGDVDTAAELASADAMVAAAPAVPDSGAPRGGSSLLIPAVVLVIAGLALAVGSRRRWRLPGVRREG